MCKENRHGYQLNFLGFLEDYNGGAIILQTYSKAQIQRCGFVGNEAANSGGSVYNTRRSFVNISHSYFNSNRAANNGGSLLVHHSGLVIDFCTFKNDTAGSGGSIAIENVGNGSVINSSFQGCEAEIGGCMAVTLESTITVKDSQILQSSSVSNGGGVTVKHLSFLIGTNLTIINCYSLDGGGISVDDASKAFLDNSHFANNSALEVGGAISCKQSHVDLDTLLIEHNAVGNNGSGVYLNNCNLAADNVTFAGNNASSYGGGIYSMSSFVKLHNCKGNENNAMKMGGMITATETTVLNSVNLKLTFNDFSNNDIIIVNKSTGDMIYTKLEMNRTYLLCPITVKEFSKVIMDSLHTVFTTNLSELRNSSQNITEDKKFPFNLICTDETSSTSNITTGNLNF